MPLSLFVCIALVLACGVLAAATSAWHRKTRVFSPKTLYLDGLHMASNNLHSEKLQAIPNTSAEHFGQQVYTRPQESAQQDTLLYTVNTVATMLLSSDVDTFSKILTQCMEKIGASVGVDRVYIWKNHSQDNGLYCTQLYEWSGGAEPQQGNELTVAVPFPDNWYPSLSTDNCINGMVKSFSGYEREHLEAQGIASIAVVPVFLHNEFWGFVGFDDCRRERVFSKSEESILRSVSLLFATAMLRNEMTANLMKAKEESDHNAKAKADFLATMSHEIRTPMNAITGMISIARMTSDPERIERCLDHIDTASGQLLAIIDDVLDMSKIEAGKLELVNEAFELIPMLHNIQSFISVRALEKKQSFSMEFVPPLPKVLIGDSMRISQLILNLLTNAVKFTPEGGDIRLRAASVSSSFDGDIDLEIAVSDTGIGIAPEDRGRLFSKFEQADRGITRRFGGTGLGLAICKNIAALMHGAIEVQSAPGKGSTFTAHLRVKIGSSDMLPGNSVIQGSLDGIFAGKCLLVVDDIAINREIVLTLLEKTGLVMDTAQNGQEAVDMFTANPARYDAILMDIQMPDKDGYTATEEIRAMKVPHAQNIPIIAMTAHAFAEDVERSFQAGMTEHIAKPVQFEILVNKIAKYLK